SCLDIPGYTPGSAQCNPRRGSTPSICILQCQQYFRVERLSTHNGYCRQCGAFALETFTNTCVINTTKHSNIAAADDHIPSLRFDGLPTENRKRRFFFLCGGTINVYPLSFHDPRDGFGWGVYIVPM